MSRELKFRVWDNLKKEWVSNKQIWRIKTDSGGYGEILPPAIYWRQHPQGLTIQQFTGLYDKNGKEIYEGDILEIPNSEIGKNSIREKYCNVWYSDFTGSWVVSYNHLYSEVSHDLYHHVHDYNVIGNIFQNDNLML
jgi:uncharacterized phage protein (TIGR01671 family)